MTKEEYIGTIDLDGKKVDIGIDDYGQQYIFSFKNEKGEIEEMGCGSFNTNFLNDIIFIVDREGFLSRKYDYDELYKQLGFER